jgi:pimeloyl-ACP methyl ester carboxylesterase
LNESACATRRRVLFVHGYDPRGPGPYHALMTEEAAEGRLEVGPRQGARWSLAVDWPQARAEADFEVLRWDDVVRSLWVRGGPARWISWRFLPAYVRSGVLGRAAREHRPLFWALILPALASGVFWAVLLGATVAVVAVIAAVMDRLGADVRWAAAGLVVPLVGPLLWRRFRDRIDLDWLSQCFDVLVRFRTLPPLREARIDAMAARIVAVVTEAGAGPVVVVGHSIGSLFAAAAVSRALAQEPAVARAASLVTLGQCLSIYAGLGGDPEWRRDLDRLVASDIPWTDVTSPADAASSGRWPPLAFSGHDARGARIDARSPRFHQALAPDRLRRLRRDPYAMHFQYLRLSDHPDVYDIRRLIVGPADAGS